jgi:hypothetical protein
MVPGDLQRESFARYPPQARLFAVTNLPTLKRMPLVLLALVLRQAMQYDWCFPAEQQQLTDQFELLKQLDAVSFDRLMAPFSSIARSSELRDMDWVNHPQQFSEHLTAYLWSQQQIDQYHEAAQAYQQYSQKVLEEKSPVAPRWTVVAIGRGAELTDYPLFRKLLPHGTLFTQLDPSGGLDILLSEVRSRSEKYPMEYGHWYIDGGEPQEASADVQGLTIMSYDKLVPVARRELALLNQFTNRSGSGGASAVEAVSSYVAGLSPDDLGLKGTAKDAALRHFEVNILTQGAGCQIYSTTFVQWASRECLHRAQPLTLFARFASRQASAPMEQLLTRDPLQQPQDKQGSLIDADMGAYYTWINQSRLADANQSRFLVWLEGQQLACAISPTLAAGTTSTASANLRQVLEWMR